jgi:hypothetical protein
MLKAYIRGFFFGSLAGSTALICPRKKNVPQGLKAE